MLRFEFFQGTEGVVPCVAQLIIVAPVARVSTIRQLSDSFREKLRQIKGRGGEEKDDVQNRG